MIGKLWQSIRSGSSFAQVLLGRYDRWIRTMDIVRQAEPDLVQVMSMFHGQKLTDRDAEIVQLRRELAGLSKDNIDLSAERDRWRMVATVESDAATNWYANYVKIAQELQSLKIGYKQLYDRVHMPRTDEFFSAVQLEAAHQVDRWSRAGGGKLDSDWFWLVGYLAGKVLRYSGAKDRDSQEKRMHHIVSTAAVLLNWWRSVTGVSREMRPGIADPFPILSPQSAAVPAVAGQAEPVADDPSGVAGVSP